MTAAACSRLTVSPACWADSPAACTPQPGSVYALLLDVAGEDEGVRGIDGSLTMANPKRDATALTIVEVSRSKSAELSTPVEKVIHTPVDNLPVYTPVLRRQWLGTSHTRAAQRDPRTGTGVERARRGGGCHRGGRRAGFVFGAFPAGEGFPVHLQQRFQVTVRLGFSRYRGFRALARTSLARFPSRPPTPPPAGIPAAVKSLHLRGAGRR